MFLKHVSYYLFARGVPGLINFVALSIYTRLILPDEYGRYALALATVSFANAVLFQWLQMGLLRFLPRYIDNEDRLLSTLLAGYLVVVAITGAMAAAVCAIFQSGPWLTILPVALILLWVQSWLDINLQLLASRLNPLRYGVLSSVRATLALIVGGGLAWAGWQAHAPLLGLVIGGAFALLVATRGVWCCASYKKADVGLLQEIAKYGLPLGATFVFSFIISTSDRYLIAWLINGQSVGLYSAGYDLAQFSLGVLMMIVNLAAYPLIVRALEFEGIEAARNQLNQQGTVLLAITAPVAASLIVLANNISEVLLGAQFRASAAEILPWIACAAFVGGFKSYYFDLAFQLGKHTIGQVKIIIVASLINVLFNLILIPNYGILGAALATLVAYSAGLFLSAFFGRRYFRFPGIPKHSSKVLVAVALMVVAIWPFRAQQGAMALIGQVLFGWGCYAGAMFLLNPGDLRAATMRKICKIWQ